MSTPLLFKQRFVIVAWNKSNQINKRGNIPTGGSTGKAKAIGGGGHELWAVLYADDAGIVLRPP